MGISKQNCVCMGRDPKKNSEFSTKDRFLPTHQICFSNISTTKAWIFMKFFVVICLKFHEDLCINAHARVVNACALFEGKLF